MNQFFKYSLFGALIWIMTACGPVKSTALIIDAEVAFKAATTAEGKRRAPYEFTMAQMYLEQAKQKQSRSEYKAAIKFAQKALTFAKQARDYALSGRPVKNVQPPVTPKPTQSVTPIAPIQTPTVLPPAQVEPVTPATKSEETNAPTEAENK